MTPENTADAYQGVGLDRYESFLYANPLFHSGTGATGTNRMPHGDVRVIPEYFHGNISLAEAKLRLMTAHLGEGAFLMTMDYSSCDTIVLGMVHAGRCYFTKIHPSHKGLLLDGMPCSRVISNVDELILHLGKHKESLPSPLRHSISTASNDNYQKDIIFVGRGQSAGLQDDAFDVTTRATVSGHFSIDTLRAKSIGYVPVLCNLVRIPRGMPVYLNDSGGMRPLNVGEEATSFAANFLFVAVDDLRSSAYRPAAAHMYPSLQKRSGQSHDNDSPPRYEEPVLGAGPGSYYDVDTKIEADTVGHNAKGSGSHYYSSVMDSAFGESMGNDSISTPYYGTLTTSDRSGVGYSHSMADVYGAPGLGFYSIPPVDSSTDSAGYNEEDHFGFGEEGANNVYDLGGASTYAESTSYNGAVGRGGHNVYYSIANMTEIGSSNSDGLPSSSHTSSTRHIHALAHDNERIIYDLGMSDDRSSYYKVVANGPKS